MDLKFCKSLVELPHHFSMNVPKLKRLDMYGCSNLKMLPKPIGLLAHLVALDLTACQNLTCLWENDANIQVKELFFCQWIGDI